ncbi:MAG: prenyltransferase/squalene oxidase repeat-containing protein [Bacteroidota bacterium]
MSLKINSRLFDTNDKLYESLLSFKNEDKFFRSQPNSQSKPSFTTTGIAILALIEYGDLINAQDISKEAIRYLQKNKHDAFPSENGEDYHIMSNSWMLYAILECLPSHSEELIEFLYWFINHQNDNGSWDLYPGFTSSKPIWTAYSLNVVVKYFDLISSNHKSELYEKHIKNIEVAIKKGLDYLIGCRSNSVKKEGLLLWNLTATEEDGELSFGTTSMCLHVLHKIGNSLNKNEIAIDVERTLIKIIKGYNPDENKIYLNRQEINLWDMIEDHSYKTYYWGFYVPLEIVTFLRFMDNEEFLTQENYFPLINFFIDSLINSVVKVEQDCYGTKGNPNSDGLKVWATGQSVIVLSRLKRNLHRTCYKIIRELSDKNNILAEIEIVTTEALIKRRKRFLIVFNILLFTLVLTPIFILIRVVRWELIEPYTLPLSIAISLAGIMGINLYLKDFIIKLSNSSHKILGYNKLIDNIKNLLETHTTKPT